MRLSIIALLLAFSSSIALANAPIDLKKAYPSVIGSGKLTWLFIKAYDAELRAAKPEWSYYQPFALTLRYDMGFTAEELIGRTIDEMKGQASLDDTAASAYASALEGVWSDVKQGDTITAEFVAKTSTVQFYKNNEPTGSVDDPNFAKRFFDIWLGEKSSEPKLRNKLLGQ